MAEQEKLAHAQWEAGYIQALKEVRKYIEDNREPKLREIVSGKEIPKEDSVRLDVYSEICFEMEKMIDEL